ncbi:MAG: hypothetical protein R3D88_06120 [Alphaproteobacteria bacterium]
MTHRIPFLLVVSALSLSACQTFEGIKKDFSTLSNNVSSGVSSMTSSDDSKEPQAIAPVTFNNESCPPIIIDPGHEKAAEFEDMEKPSAATEISHVQLMGTQTECGLKEDKLEVRADLTFRGALGPKAKRKEGDQPFFAYPYYVAVTDDQGNKLAEELFAASVTYGKDQSQIELVETIRQKLPLHKDGTIPGYQVHIGFQLSPEQISYNGAK